MAKIRGIKPETWTDETFVELSPLARLLYIGMWNYACDNGHLEDRSKQLKMRLLPGDDCNVAELLRELAEYGRIVRDEGWITIPTLRDHQRIDKRWFVTCDKPGCVKPEAESRNPERKPRGGHDEATSSARRDPAVASSGPRDDVDVDGDLMVSGGDRVTTTALAVATPIRPDVDRICHHLADRIEANGSKRPTITKRWHDAARLMLDADKRPEADVHAAIDWCQSDEFWRANIMSVPKLREKYESLRLQASRRTGPTSRNDEFRAMQERQMARAIEREREMGLRP